MGIEQIQINQTKALPPAFQFNCSQMEFICAKSYDCRGAGEKMSGNSLRGPVMDRLNSLWPETDLWAKERRNCVGLRRERVTGSLAWFWISPDCARWSANAATCARSTRSEFTAC